MENNGETTTAPAPVEQCNRCGQPFKEGEPRHTVMLLSGKWAIPPKVIVHDLCRYFEVGEAIPANLPELVHTLARKIYGRERFNPTDVL